jgi:multisubunit Na+/H+ antiporter MnhB subunit
VPAYAVGSESVFSCVLRSRLPAIATRQIRYWLAAMIVLLVFGTVVGLVWADTSDAAGAFAGVTNVVSAVGIVALLIALAVKRRQRS